MWKGESRFRFCPAEEASPTFKPGDRVRMVHSIDSFGTVQSDVEPSPEFGHPRQLILWDRTEKATAWNPAFLRPSESRWEDDPEVVDVDPHFVSRKRSRSETIARRNGLSVREGIA